METFGERLARFRKEKKYTQEELAKKAGVTRATVNRYEKLDLSPRCPDILREIASALDVSYDMLTTGRGETDKVIFNTMFAGGKISESDMTILNALIEQKVREVLREKEKEKEKENG